MGERELNSHKGNSKQQMESYPPPPTDYIPSAVKASQPINIETILFIIIIQYVTKLLSCNT